MLKLLWQAFQALKAGEQLAHTSVWKNAQVTSNLVYVILLVLVSIARLKYPGFMPSDEVLLKISGGVTMALGGVNGYLTVATTTKIGIN